MCLLDRKINLVSSMVLRSHSLSVWDEDMHGRLCCAVALAPVISCSCTSPPSSYFLYKLLKLSCAVFYSSSIFLIFFDVCRQDMHDALSLGRSLHFLDCNTYIPILLRFSHLQETMYTMSHLFTISVSQAFAMR